MKFRLTISSLLFAVAACGGEAPVSDSVRCNLGLFDLDDGQTLSIVGSARDPKSLRYIFPDGNAATLKATGENAYAAGDGAPYAELSFNGCPASELALSADGKSYAGRRKALIVEETTFDSGGTEIFGKLVQAADTEPRALVIWVEGSDSKPSTDYNYWQYILPANGIAVFAYDKRGTGRSKGKQTADFDIRADDTVAAHEAALSLLNETAIPAGYLGGSQGGWVAPLAASRSDADFVIVAYGLAEGVTGEDREEVADDLKRAGFGPEELAKARELTKASAAIVKSDWKEGWEEFSALKKKYKNEPWMKSIKEESYTGVMLHKPLWLVRILGPMMDQDVSFDYEPEPVLRDLEIPQLWILAEEDRSAPIEPTLSILRNLQITNPELSIAVFPEADHGIIIRYEKDGNERYRYADGYFGIVADWIGNYQTAGPSLVEGTD